MVIPPYLKSIIFSKYLEIGLRMCANRANIGRFFADYDVAAVRALPNGVAVFREDQTALDVGEQLSVSFLVHFFNLADFLKQKRDVVKALFARGLCKARIQDRKSVV